jgi:hypothetical protein
MNYLSKTETFQRLAEMKAKPYLEMVAESQPNIDLKHAAMVGTAIPLIDHLVSEVQTLERELKDDTKVELSYIQHLLHMEALQSDNESIRTIANIARKLKLDSLADELTELVNQEKQQPCTK